MNQKALQRITAAGQQLIATDQTLIVYHTLNAEDVQEIFEHPGRWRAKDLRNYGQWLARNNFKAAYKIFTDGGLGVCVSIGGIPIV